MINVTTQELEIQNNRPQLDLIFCIDISGSMSGKKLEQVKDSLDFLLGQLNEGDRVSLIEFDNKVNILAKLNPMTKENIKKY